MKDNLRKVSAGRLCVVSYVKKMVVNTHVIYLIDEDRKKHCRLLGKCSVRLQHS